MATIVQYGIAADTQVKSWAIGPQWRCCSCQCLFILEDTDIIHPTWAERCPDGNQGAEVVCPNPECRRVLEVRKHSASTNGTYAPGSGVKRLGEYNNAW